MHRSIIAAVLTAGLLLSACHKDHGDETAAALGQVVAAARAPAYVPKARWKVVRAIYQDHQGAPLWLDHDKPSARARALVEAIGHADAQGLRPRDYDLAGLERALERAYKAKERTPADLAALDVRLTALYLDYGGDLLAGRLDPQAVDTGWYIKARRASIDSTLRAAAGGADFEAMTAPLLPRQKDYAELVAWLARYRAIAARGGWGTVPAGGTIGRGARGPRVAALRARLAASGDLDAAAAAAGAAPYDAALAAAVARFRERHGLSGDGPAPSARDSVADAATLAALDVPVQQRIRQIELNLERIRWLPQDFGPRYVLVNIPDYQLHAYDGGREALAMRVVVGKQYESATPVFADTMSYVVFHPKWNVPADIVKGEIVPKMQANVHWAAEHGYEILDPKNDSVVIDPEKIDWKGVDTATFDYRVRQKSGDENSLGRIKFMFPNAFDIYLHDTPAKALFDRRERAFSHGCVRVAEPERLAQYVFAGDDTWTGDKIGEALADTVTVSAKVRRRLPVYIVYLTAFSRGDTLQFRGDPYGADRRAMAKLGPAVPADTALYARIHELMEG